MNELRNLLFIVLVGWSSLVWGQTAITVDEASQDPDFAIQGEYVTDATAAEQKSVQVVALGEGTFRVVIHNGGLPGAGWDRKPPQVLPEEESDAVRELISQLKVEKTQRQSPTLGKQPPKDAVVLFDGTKETFAKHWKDGARISDDGLLMEGATSVDTFQDFTAHIEFLLPYMPKARGQGRGNSGAYYQGRYETQVLDSFGLAGKNNETGGIYEIRDPDLNMCFPPLTWQTYDVDFVAARWDGDKKVSNARLTVRLNGIVVQRDVEVPRITRAAPVKESPEPGPLYFQNHGNPVRFRNIWILPRDAEQEAKRPLIPGFERFHAATPDAAGGRLLIGELGCVKCHAASKELDALVNAKQAPILSKVGERARPQWITDFIAAPHAVKPGTTMPSVFSGWEEQERNEAVLALANFLTSTGTLAEQSEDVKAIGRGRRLFHSIGCVACHKPFDEDVKVATATSVPLPDLKEKYTVPSLREFLKNPHAVRPSGRMPELKYEKDEAQDIAHYLLAGAKRALPRNVHYKAYKGRWDELPDFSNFTPFDEGTCSGLDLSVAGTNNRFGVVYNAYYLAKQAGEYRFWMGSDDGSRLLVDGKEIVNVDGIHPHTIKEGRIQLDAGVHEIQVEYFEMEGEESISLEVQPPGQPRQDASLLLTINKDGSPVENEDAQSESDVDGGLVFRRDASLIGRGRELFGELGCANCHVLEDKGEQLKSNPGKALAELNMSGGCLGSVQKKSTSPNFDLSPAQQNAIAAAVAEKSPVDSDVIHQTMVTFNCYACHQRNDVGGPEFDRNPLFLTTQHEMGDEGRVPPPLNGVGDKLRENWLRNVLQNGANDRPYMVTRMPKFGGDNVGHLAKAFVEADQRNEAQLAQFDDPEHRVKSAGRELVGDNGLACIKCHTFSKYRATGIQAISLTDMTRRIREDWFLRYLYEPSKYRPGTRMPTGFPNGEAVVKDIYDGDPNKQISAIWTFLSEGDKAGIPDGLIADMIELKPESEPILYRNFIEGLSPRGIAVGYPENAHLAWDANELCMKLIWHGKFIDASLHWNGRGQGRQRPLGDHIMQFEPAIPFDQLASRDAAWPTESVRTRDGFQFLGYELDEKGRPTFRYETPFGVISDFPEPRPRSEEEGTFVRHLSIASNKAAENVYFRAAVGKSIEETGDGFLIDDAIRIQLSVEGAFIRELNGQKELLIPVDLKDGELSFTQKISW